MKFLVVWWYNYNKKYHMVLVIRFLDKVILKKFCVVILLSLIHI